VEAVWKMKLRKAVIEEIKLNKKLMGDTYGINEFGFENLSGGGVGNKLLFGWQPSGRSTKMV